MRPPRICFVGGVYHVTVRCNNREFFFQDEEDFRIFLELVLRAKLLYNVHVYAYILTNNHVHLIVGTPKEPTLSPFMQYVNGNYAKAYNKRHGKTGRFWGARFGSVVIESDTQFFNTLFYIEFNMVRCQKVENPGDWKWSSYHAHAAGEENPILDFHDLYLALGSTPEERQRIYQEMAAAYGQERGLSRRPELTSGVILGSRTFVESLLEECGKIADYFRNRPVFEMEADCFSLRRLVPDPGG